MAIDGDIYLPLFTAAGTGTADSQLIDGDLSLPELTLDASMIPERVLPAFTLEATGFAGTVAVGRVNLLALTLEGSLEGPLPLPALSLEATLLNGSALDGDSLLPSLEAAGTGLTGNAAEGDASLPQWEVAGDTGAFGDIRIPDFSLSATGLTGAVGPGAALLPAFSLDAQMMQSGAADGSITLAEFTLNASASSTTFIVGDVALASFTLNAQGFTGNTATGELTLPLLTLSADGYASQTGTATVTLPLLSVDGWMQSSVAAPVFTSVVLNTQTKATSTYSGLNANSLANFNGLVLAATASGIVALQGDSDGGTAIAAVVTGGVSDLNSEQFKRVLCGYAGYRADGMLELTLITDQHHEHVYSLAPRRIDEVHASRVKFGRGVDGRYWQWSLANKAGADFALDTLTLQATPTSRKV